MRTLRSNPAISVSLNGKPGLLTKPGDIRFTVTPLCFYPYTFIIFYFCQGNTGTTCKNGNRYQTSKTWNSDFDLIPHWVKWLNRPWQSFGLNWSKSFDSTRLAAFWVESIWPGCQAWSKFWNCVNVSSHWEAVHPNKHVILEWWLMMAAISYSGILLLPARSGWQTPPMETPLRCSSSSALWTAPCLPWLLFGCKNHPFRPFSVRPEGCMMERGPAWGSRLDQAPTSHSVGTAIKGWQGAPVYSHGMSRKWSAPQL